MIVIGFCFLPASYVAYVVKEREVKAKHQQVITSPHITSHHLTSPHITS